MSDENRDIPSHYNLFYQDEMGTSTWNTFPLFHHNYDHVGVDIPSNYMNLADSSHGSIDHYNSINSTLFDMSCSSSDVICPTDGGSKKRRDGNNRSGGGVESSDLNLLPPAHFSLSSSSSEAAAEKDSGKSKKDGHQLEKDWEEGDGNDDEKYNKVNNPIKKEKRQRQPRYAFMTKSVIDNLEDGYKWRKYGQKAVKNSPFPRSYYRCTTQKCAVKKRIERSYEDPSTVITTYEGKHNHHSPAMLRGNAAGILFPSSSSFLQGSTSMGSSFPQHILTQMLPLNINNQQGDHHPDSSMFYRHHDPRKQQQQQQLFQDPDYGFLQDILPSFTHKEEP